MSSKSTKKGNKKVVRAKPSPLPVTLLSGFLGAGKTTLLKHILESNKHKLKIAVIVNDMAELNIDTSLVEKSGLIHTKQEIVSMQNGCICCTLRTDLIREISRLQQLGGFDYLVIESTGISEPMQVAESFCADPHTVELAENEEDMLWNTARLDTLVTVVDARDFPGMMDSLQSFNEKFGSAGAASEEDAEGEKNIGQLLLEQVEFASVIVLNKCDLIDDAQKSVVVDLIKTLNPTAKVVLSSFGNVDLDVIINTNLFDMETAKLAPGWLQSLHQKGVAEVGFRAAASASETAEYGVSSFVYRRSLPFHPTRLHALLASILNFPYPKSFRKSPVAARNTFLEASKLQAMREQFGWLLRSKGFCWVAGRDEMMGEWAQAGRFINITPLMPWYADTPEEEWTTVSTEGEKEAIRATIKPVYGDRRQEIVFIGTNLQEEFLTKALDACLLSETDLAVHNIHARGAYLDPLPCWVQDISEPQMMWNTVLRVGQRQEILVREGLELELGCVCLNIAIPDDLEVEDAAFAATNTVSVKVWLDFAHQSTLLCTLRPDRCEQVPLGLTICSGSKLPAENEHYTLRMELSNLTKRMHCAADSTSASRGKMISSVAAPPLTSLPEECYEVHVVGMVCEAHTHGGDEEAEDGVCPL